MKLERKWLISVIFVIVLLTVYLFPTPKKTFEALSAAVPEEQLLLYQGFMNQFRPHRLVINGTAWEYIVAGPPAREAVLFLHGMTGAYDIWWNQIVALRSDYHIISVTYPPVDSLEELSEGILRILDSQNIRVANVVGTSLGGYLAQYLIATHPERFSRAVLSNTLPPNDVIRKQYGAIGAALPFLPEWLIMQVLQYSLNENAIPASGSDAFLRAYLLSVVGGRLTKAQVIGRYRVLVEPFTPIDPLAQGIGVLIIESKNDPLIDEELRNLVKETYPVALVYTFDNAGHFPYVYLPEEYNQQLLKFFLTPIIK